MKSVNDLKQHKKVLLELLKEFDRVCKNNDIHYMVFCGTALGAVRHSGFIPWDDDLDVAMLRCDYERFMRIAPKELKPQYFLQVEMSEDWPLSFSKLRKNKTTCLEKFHPKNKKMHQGIYIDIFPCDNASDKKIIRKIQFYISRIVLANTLFKRGYETDNKLKKAFMACCSILPIKQLHRFSKGVNIKENQYVQTFLSCTSRYKKGIYELQWFTKTIEMDFEDMKVPVSAYYDELLTTLYGDYMKIPSVEERKIKEHAILVDIERDYSEYESFRDNMKFDIYTRNIH